MESYTGFYFQKTYDCNLECKHCFQGSGPKRKDTTISEENFRRVIDNLPNEKINLHLTGGEIFKDRKRLWRDLDYVFENKKDSKIGLQTNGFWAVNEKKTEKILSRLHEYGICRLDVTSKDKYHREAGLNTNILGNIRRINRMHNFIPKLIIRGAANEEGIFPTERGKNIFDKENFYYPSNWEACRGVFEAEEDLTINPKGNTYMCCFNLFKLPGNLINNSYEEIIEMAKENPELKILNEEGIRGFAKIKGLSSSEADHEIISHGKCGLCAKLNGLVD